MSGLAVRSRWWLWVLAGLVLAAAIAVTVGRSGGGHATAPGDVRASVRALVSRSIPGAILFVRQGDRSYTVTAGYADPRRRIPMRAGDTYQIGSTTKTYTAVLVMRLVQQGRIRLDDPVSKYLPGLLRDGRRITVRELLSHTTGLYDFANDPGFVTPYLRGRFGTDWTPRQLVAFAATRPLEFRPATQFAYSNTNFIVLGLLAERVGGAPYAQQLRDFIVRPLGLRHTSLPSGNRTLPDVHGSVSLRAYDKHASAAPVDTGLLSPSMAWSAGGIRGTAEDVADFYRGLMTGKLLSRATVAAMEDTSRTGGAYGLGLMPTGELGYEWGGYTQPINERCGLAWGHGGNFPGYYELPISSPDGSRQAVLVINSDPTLMQDQLPKLYAVLDTAYCRGVR